ncbi:MAG: LysM peptidoglycan-binding domain-containing protein [Pontibacterium sp.]
MSFFSRVLLSRPTLCSLSLTALVALSGCQTLQNTGATPNTSPDEALASDMPNSNTNDADVALPELLTPNASTQDEEGLNASIIDEGHTVEPVEPEATDLWTLTRNNFGLNYQQSQPAIEASLKWYVKHPTYITRVTKRAENTYHYILHEVLKRGMPAEIALLPIVESAYDPFAYSHGRAAGPWQFIPSTAKHFGIKDNWWYDGRRDWIESTDKALNYLELLYKRFDDWELALAAYNAGGGNVSLAMKKNRRKDLPTDYWSLNLPRETEGYVPKLLALARIVADPDKYDLKLTPLEQGQRFAIIETGGQIDLSQAAKLADMEVKDLYLLNPGFNRWATSPDGPHRLLVPATKADTFSQNLATLPKGERVNWTRYTIKSGDSLIAIAKDFNTQVSVIKQANNLTDNNIRAGKTLMIPSALNPSGDYVLSEIQRLHAKQRAIQSKSNRQSVKHTVASGDSFWSIARKHKVSVKQLASWNNMAPGDTLSIGKTLTIWKSAPTSSNPRAQVRKVGYQVRSGDSLSRIASKFNVSVSNIVSWNSISKNDYLQPGQKLTLFVDVTR